MPGSVTGALVGVVRRLDGALVVPVQRGSLAAVKSANDGTGSSDLGIRLSRDRFRHLRPWSGDEGRAAGTEELSYLFGIGIPPGSSQQYGSSTATILP